MDRGVGNHVVAVAAVVQVELDSSPKSSPAVVVGADAALGEEMVHEACHC